MGINNKEKGLRTTPYMKTDELIQWMKLAVLLGELQVSAEATKNKEWHKYLCMCASFLKKVIDSRIKLLDAKQCQSVIRRRKHSEIKLWTSDELRLPKAMQGGDEQERVTVAYEDLLDIADLALNSCMACPQGECVKDCYYRKVFHRVSLPVCRDNPKDGECEFNHLNVGETRQIIPQNQRESHYYDEDYVL